MRNGRSPAASIGLWLLLGGLVAACSSPAIPSSGAPPDRWGYWAVWSPAVGTETGDEDGAVLWTRHRRVADRLERGEALNVDELGRLRSGLLLQLFVAPVDPPAVTGAEVMAVCGEWLHHERVIFDPPLTVGPDGRVTPDGAVVTWEARLTASDRIEGSWSGGRCRGSWDGDGTGSMAEEGWSRFYPEEILDAPWYAVADWGIELTTLGRHPEERQDLCVVVRFDQPTDLDAWLELQFGRGGFMPGDVVLDCDGGGIDLVVEVDGRTEIESFGWSGNTVQYGVVATVRGTATLRHLGLTPLTSRFSWSSRGLVAGDEPPDPIIDSLYRNALACGLSPVFSSWWGTDGSGPVPIVHPFVDPPRCN